MSLPARLLPGAAPVQAPEHLDGQRRDDAAELADGRWSVRNTWRWFARLLIRYQWPILAVAGLTALILGFIGGWNLVRQENPQMNQPWTYAAYWSLQDFKLSAPDHPRLPWELNVARFLAPVVTGWAGLSALASLFREQIRQMWIPWISGHVVICGLGYVGAMFLRHLQLDGIRVVVVEPDTANPHLELCRSLGVLVIVGDAQRQRALQAAGAERASRVLAVAPDDAINTQIVATARQLTGRLSRQLGCLARITDPDLCEVLRIQEAHRGDPALSVDFFNTDEIGARLLLESFPLDIERDKPHILVAHLDDLGGWVVYHAARRWCETRRDPTVKLMVTVLDHHAEERKDALLCQHPALTEVCEFICFSNLRTVHELRKHHDAAGAPPVSRAYVTAYRDEQGFPTALKLRHELGPAIPVVVALSHAHGVAGLLGDVKAADTRLDVDVFSALEQTCTTELVRGGSFEPMAHAIHERWRRDRLAKGKAATTWEELPESLKESNRAQARDIPMKLRMVGCAMAPLRDWDAQDFPFSVEEVEELAIEEHDRWNHERAADGWTLDKTLAEADHESKKTPFLVPFEKLPPDIAEYDRISVRAIPSILASAGIQIIRTVETPTAAATERASSA